MAIEIETLHHVSLSVTDLERARAFYGAASLDAHFETAHIRGALERFPELLAEELDLRRYALVG